MHKKFTKGALIILRFLLISRFQAKFRQNGETANDALVFEPKILELCFSIHFI